MSMWSSSVSRPAPGASGPSLGPALPLRPGVTGRPARPLGPSLGPSDGRGIEPRPSRRLPLFPQHAPTRQPDDMRRRVSELREWPASADECLANAANAQPAVAGRADASPGTGRAVSTCQSSQLRQHTGRAGVSTKHARTLGKTAPAFCAVQQVLCRPDPGLKKAGAEREIRAGVSVVANVCPFSGMTCNCLKNNLQTASEFYLICILSDIVSLECTIS